MIGEDLKEVQEQVRRIVEDATDIVAGIKAWILLSKEGLPIVSAMGEGYEEAEIAAIAASILNVADLAAEKMEQGEQEQVLLTNEKGLILMKSAGEKAILMFAATRKVKPGMLVLAAKNATEQIATVL